MQVPPQARNLGGIMKIRRMPAQGGSGGGDGKNELQRVAGGKGGNLDPRLGKGSLQFGDAGGGVDAERQLGRLWLQLHADADAGGLLRQQVELQGAAAAVG